MSISSLKKRIFHGRDGQSKYWTLVDRIGELTRSADDLNSALSGAVTEMGRLFDVTRAAILLKQEKGFKNAGDYCAPEIGPITKENLRLLDAEIAREFASTASITEVTQEQIASRFKSLLEGI